MTVITLTTDFGLADPYVAEMKAVILAIDPAITIVDISHLVEKFNVQMGAFILAEAVPYFQKGSIHIAVIDPDVGTRRRAIAVQTERAFFIGPDNGVFDLASGCSGRLKSMREITNREFMLPKVSRTFNGRDVFAPAAAYLATGRPISGLGPEISEAKRLQFPKVREEDHVLIGQVIHVDGFGNVVTNFPAKVLRMKEWTSVNVTVKDRDLNMPVQKTYANVRKSQTLAIIGSHGFLEIAVNRGNASAALGIMKGDEIRLSLKKKQHN